MNRPLLIASIALALLLVILSAASYSSLPQQIPMHFGPVGVDRWARKTWFTWFGLPLMALGLCAINYVIGALLAGRPSLMNVPRKERLLALPRERQRRVMRWWWVLVQSIGFIELLIMSEAQYGIWRAAAANENAGRAIAVLATVTSLCVLPLAFALIWQMRAEVERQEMASE